MGENEKKGWVKVSRFLFVEFYLALKIISRIVERMDLINPQRFLIKSVKSQDKSHNHTKNEDRNFLSFYLIYG